MFPNSNIFIERRGCGTKIAQNLYVSRIRLYKCTLQASHQRHNLSMNMDYTLTAISDLLRSLGFVWKIPVGGFRRWVLCKHNRGGATVAFNSSYCACACVRLPSINTDTCTQRAQSDNSHKHIIIETGKICSVQDKIYI